MPAKTVSTRKNPVSSSIEAALQSSSVNLVAIAARRRRGKKTQAERSSDTRGVVIEATIRCLNTLGFSDTTFSTISKEAGVSRGAMQHHYPEKNFLVATALEVLCHRLLDDFPNQAIKMPVGSKRMTFVLDRLWLATLTPAIAAMADVRIAARTDIRLRDMLLPFERALRAREIKSIAEAFGGAYGRAPDFDHRVEAVLGVMRGLAIRLAYGWERSEIDAAWAVARQDFIVGFMSSVND